MRLYRLPTEILWVNDGWREFEARDADNAMAVYRQRWSNSANHVGLANLQIKLGDGWRFAGETPSYLGGYSRKS
jgi:hypothetical protein